MGGVQRTPPRPRARPAADSGLFKPQAFNQALALDPGSPAAQAGRGEVAVAMDENAEAITFLKAALAVVPEA